MPVCPLKEDLTSESKHALAKSILVRNLLQRLCSADVIGISFCGPNSFTSMTSMPTWPDFRRYTSIKAMSLQELVGDVCAGLSASRATQSIMQILQFRSRYSEAFLTLLESIERLAESCFAPGWNLDDGELLHEFHLPSAGPSRTIGFCVLSKLCLSDCSLNSS